MQIVYGQYASWRYRFLNDRDVINLEYSQQQKALLVEWLEWLAAMYDSTVARMDRPWDRQRQRTNTITFSSVDDFTQNNRIGWANVGRGTLAVRTAHQSSEDVFLTLAHEMAHFLMHRLKLAMRRNDDPGYRHYCRSDVEENFCNVWAYTMLTLYTGGGVTVQPVSGQAQVSRYQHLPYCEQNFQTTPLPFTTTVTLKGYCERATWQMRPYEIAHECNPILAVVEYAGDEWLIPATGLTIVPDGETRRYHATHPLDVLN